MKPLAPVLTLLLLAAAAVPAPAQTMGTLLPTLTWPEDDVTTSTRGCAAADQAQTCTLRE
jgi:hypothetical protein